MWSTVLKKPSYATASFVSCATSSPPAHLFGRNNAEIEVKLQIKISCWNSFKKKSP